MDLGSGVRIFTRADTASTPDTSTQIGKILNEPEGDGVGQYSQPGAEGSSQESQTSPQSVHQSDILGPQEWVAAPSSELETPQQVYDQVQVQDGECTDTQGPSAEGRLVGLNRSQGCLPLCTYQREGQEVPLIPMGGQRVRIPMSPFWPQQCPKSFYKAIEASDGPSSPERVEEHDIPGQYAADGAVQTGSNTQVSGSLVADETAGVQGQKSQLTPTNRLVYLGLTINTTHLTLTLTEKKVQKIIMGCQLALQEEQITVKGLVEINRYDVSDNTRSSSCTTPLQRASGVEDTTSKEDAVFQGESPINRKVETGATMVDNNAQLMEWTPHSPPSSQT